MKTLRERVFGSNVSTVRLPGTQFQINKTIIKDNGQVKEVEDILFQFNIAELIPLLKSMANSKGFVHGRISPMKSPNEFSSHIGIIVMPQKSTKDAD